MSLDRLKAGPVREYPQPTTHSSFNGLGVTMIARLLCAAIVLSSSPIAAQSSDSTDVASAVRAYHTALAAGDSLAALGLLAPDAVILESGGMESRAEYRSHHLAADIEFARAVPSVRGEIAVTVAGDVAWASSTSTTEGMMGDRKINAMGAELMVLSRTPEGWRIRAIHWSSRNRR